LIDVIKTCPKGDGPSGRYFSSRRADNLTAWQRLLIRLTIRPE